MVNNVIVVLFTAQQPYYLRQELSASYEYVGVPLEMHAGCPGFTVRRTLCQCKQGRYSLHQSTTLDLLAIELSQSIVVERLLNRSLRFCHF